MSCTARLQLCRLIRAKYSSLCPNHILGNCNCYDLTFSKYLFWSTEDYNSPLDLCFVLDASGSVRDHWSTLLSFVVDVVKGLNVGLEGTHIGVVIFGNSARVVLDFTIYDELTTDYEMMIRYAIESIPKPSYGERTFINRGLHLANRGVMSYVRGMRIDVKQVCTFCNILCLSVGLFACLSVSFSLSLPSPPPPRLSLPSYPCFL